jgi:1,4-dihydroxy-2-naphthoyl-CoA synthase
VGPGGRGNRPACARREQRGQQQRGQQGGRQLSTEHVITEVEDSVAWLTLNHPERYNAFDAATLAALVDAVQACGRDLSIGAVVLTGAGDKAFCSGGYLKDLASAERSELRQLYFGTIDALNAIRRIPQPVIAAVNGFAIGGGNEVVIACDFAIASDRAILGQSGPRIGSAPVVGGTNMLTLMIGEKRAKEVSFLCRRYSAEEACERGWVNEVVPHDQLRTRVREWCDEILALSPRYLEIAKITSNYWWDLLQPGFVHGEGLLWASAKSDEMVEGVTAFAEKRKPDFNQFRQREKAPS